MKYLLPIYLFFPFLLYTANAYPWEVWRDEGFPEEINISPDKPRVAEEKPRITWEALLALAETRKFSCLDNKLLYLVRTQENGRKQSVAIDLNDNNEAVCCEHLFELEDMVVKYMGSAQEGDLCAECARVTLPAL